MIRTWFRLLFMAALVLLLFLSISPAWSDLIALGNGCPEEVVQPQVQRETSPDATHAELRQVVDGNTAFALDLYHKLIEGQDQDGNIFLSPYSISLAMAMAYAGARGETADQMAETLHFTLPQERLHSAFDALDLAISARAETEGIELSTANAFWGQLGHPFLQGYIDLLAGYYGTEVRLMDFQTTPEPCREEINDWVSEKTQGKIEELLPPGSVNPLTKLVLTNAIYFKGTWKWQFDPDLTGERPFTLLDGSQVMVPMMEQGEVWLPYTEGSLDGLGYQAVELPYVGEELSMVILLPAPEWLGEEFTAEKFKEFERKLSPEWLKETLEGLETWEVDLVMPKFSFTWGFDLSDALSRLGMPLAFSAQADFSGMDGMRDLFINGIYHKAFVKVDEEGTEALGATGTTMVRAAPYEFQVNHPFIFLIRDRETGAILFLGRVLNPAG